MNQCRTRTTTKKFNVRFLDVAIGLLLRNLWVWLHHVVLSSPRRGCRRYNWGMAAGGADAALAGAGGRVFIWFGSHDNNRKGYTQVGYDLTHRSRSFGKYWAARWSLEETTPPRRWSTSPPHGSALRTYREVLSQDERQEVDQMLREIDQLESQLRQEGGRTVGQAERAHQGNTLTQWWDRINGWFRRHL